MREALTSELPDDAEKSAWPSRIHDKSAASRCCSLDHHQRYTSTNEQLLRRKIFSTRFLRCTSVFALRAAASNPPVERARLRNASAKSFLPRSGDSRGQPPRRIDRVIQRYVHESQGAKGITVIPRDGCINRDLPQARAARAVYEHLRWKRRENQLLYARVAPC